MNELFASFIFFLVSFCCTPLLKNEAHKRSLACGGVVVGSIIGLIPALRVLATGVVLRQTLISPLPGFNLSLGVDALSAFFLVAIFALSCLIGIYGWGYIKSQPRLMSSLPFFPLLVGAMAAVVTAQDGFFFLIAWEIMSLSSFFLVAAEHESREVRHAGWIYIVATHLAVAFLMVFFILLSRKTGSFSFDGFVRAGPLSPLMAGLLFVFAVIGFGTKAGIFPFHVWLPHAHPAAPSYISALMSAVMIKTGIYGIMRALTFLGPPPLWWGGLLLILGILSAVMGSLYALMQQDLKRLLAYSSIENIGIIIIGVGLGLLGITWRQPLMITLGFGGALFHVWNHALLKGVLFLGAGGVVHATHTRMLERMGGLLKNMPILGMLFIGAALAICGLPPLNGFMSEWLIYRGLFHGVWQPIGLHVFLFVAGIIGMAFAGGLILASFVKVIGVAFLGESRDEKMGEAHELPIVIIIPMIVLMTSSLVIALFPTTVWSSIAMTLRSLDPSFLSTQMDEPFVSLRLLGIFFLCFFGVSGIFIGWCRFHVQRVGQREALTWDCGFAKPTPRMQYTATSFSESIGLVFRALLRPRFSVKKPSGFFPLPGHFAETTEDLTEQRFFKPLFTAVDTTFLLIRKMQQGKIQWYLAFIFGALLILLLWEVWFGI